MRGAMAGFAALLLATAGGAGAPAVAIAAAPAASPAVAFKALSDDYIATLTRLEPVQATQLGEHRYDGDLPDVTAQGRADERAQWQRLLGALRKIDRAKLGRDDQVDYLLLANQLQYATWQIDKSRDWAWNPQYYNDTASYALYSLVSRDYAPWPERLKAATARMEKLPAFLAEERGQLDPARVPAIHAQTVAQQNAGIMETVDGTLLPQADQLSGADRARLDAAYTGLKAAVAEHQKWLDQQLVPNARGNFRLGAKLYDQKMHFALMSPMTRPQLKARAQAAVKQIRQEMFAIAQVVLAKRGERVEAPPDQLEQRTIEAALKLSYAKRPKRTELEQAARQALAEAVDFVRAKNLVEMPTGAVQVITMPKFWQGNAVAYDDPPPPLDKGLPNFFAVSPIPDDWTDEQADSFLTEYNDYMIHDLAAHEGMPGHYLQGDHEARYGSTLRHVLSSGPFVEGWAVYGEGMMADEGFMHGDPLFKLTVLKMRLRSVTNTLLDIGIHAEGMTREQAMELMEQGAFQQEREAAGKWVRAQLSSAQLLSYFTGYAEHMDLRAEAKQRWGKDYSLRRYNDAAIAHGAPPVRFVRELMFGLPVQ